MAKLTYQQKLDALSYRFYQGGAWTPKAGDFYTTSRADLELYQVVSVENGVVRTRYTEGSDTISEWPEAGFLTEGFGPRRVFVPAWVICAPPTTTPQTPVASIVPPYCAGTSFAFEPGVLHVKKDGSGHIVVNEDDFVLEDDRCEGPDGPEGSVHWIARLDASDITALRDFLNSTTAPAPQAMGSDA